MKTSQKTILSFILGIILVLIVVFVYNHFSNLVKVDKTLEQKSSQYFTLKEITPGYAPDSPDVMEFGGPWLENYEFKIQNSIRSYVMINCRQLDGCIFINKRFAIYNSEADLNYDIFGFHITEEYNKAGRIVAETSASAGGYIQRLIIDYNKGTIELFENKPDENNSDFFKVGEMILKPSEKMYPFQKN